MKNFLFEKLNRNHKVFSLLFAEAAAVIGIVMVFWTRASRLKKGYAADSFVTACVKSLLSAAVLGAYSATYAAISFAWCVGSAIGSTVVPCLMSFSAATSSRYSCGISAHLRPGCGRRRRR